MATEAITPRQDEAALNRHTRTIAALWQRAVENHTGPAYLVEETDGWREVSWEEASTAVDEIANGLLALGVRRGDAFGIIARTTLPWALFDYALGSIGTIPAPIYPTLPARDCAYVLEHSDAIGVLVEDETQRLKVEADCRRLPRLQHLLTFDDLDELRSKGRAHADSNPSALADARAAVAEDDIFTYIYTSGTTGPPKACMIRHRNYFDMVATVEQVPEFVLPGDTMLLYLPLAHNFGRCIHLLGAYVGYATAFCADPFRVAEVLPAVRPTVFPSVPRVYEKVHTAVVGSFEEATGVKRRLIDWALRVGRKASRLRQEGRSLPPALAVQHRLADKLVYSKVKAKLGGRLRVPISGGAPLAKEIAEFFHAIDILILEGYGQTECTTASHLNRPDGFRFGTVGPALPGCEQRIAEDGEILVRTPSVFAGYYKDEAATREVLDDDGWLHTGDVGHIDADGFLTITDRKKDIVVTAGGKNVSPQNIENDLKTARYVSQALVVGDRRPYLIALITLDEAEITKWAADLGQDGGLAELARKESVRALVEKAVDDANRDRPSFEQIKRFTILPRDFTAEEDEVTPTMKLRRRICEQHFATEIETLYAAQREPEETDQK